MNRLKDLRLEHNLTQAELAKAVDTSQRNISRWEKNEIEMGLNFAIILAKYFNVSIDYLAGIEDDFGIRIADKTNTDLNAEEQQLIEDYRALSPELRKMITATMDTFLRSDINAAAKRKKA